MEKEKSQRKVKVVEEVLASVGDERIKVRDVAKLFKVSEAVLYYWVNKYKEEKPDN